MMTRMKSGDRGSLGLIGSASVAAAPTRSRLGFVAGSDSASALTRPGGLVVGPAAGVPGTNRQAIMERHWQADRLGPGHLARAS